MNTAFTVRIHMSTLNRDSNLNYQAFLNPKFTN